MEIKNKIIKYLIIILGLVGGYMYDNICIK